jgi:DNA-directed RNA polymerase specialized sigma24 family protein/predicted Ser/Thr protein kinase
MNSQELLKRVEAGDSQATAAIFDRYVQRLLALARTRVGAKLRRRIDAEDVVQSAYRSFFVHAENHEYILSEAGDLWRLLARITLNKLYSQVEKHTAARRNIHREYEPSDALRDDPAALEPTAAEVIALSEQLQLITKSLASTEQIVFGAHLRGDAIDTISNAIKKSPRTVRRLLAHIRQKIENRLLADEGPAGLDVEAQTHRNADPRAPLSYSDFRLERLLGSGGMGKVYRAMRHSTGSHVAIKSLVKSRQADKNSVEKFLQEAQILASLDHPNIVGFQGVGRFPSGGYFIAMDFIDGTDLQTRIAVRPLPVDDAVRIVGVVSRAIAHAHERGIVHGNIKPANVLIDQASRVVVTDFGLAQFSNPDSTTRPWLVGGTTGYIAPEVRELGCLPGPLADIYGLGALLWSLLTGSIPNNLDHYRDDAEIPRSLFAVCHKCLAVDPERRFQSVAELIEQLDTLFVRSAERNAAS